MEGDGEGSHARLSFWINTHFKTERNSSDYFVDWNIQIKKVISHMPTTVARAPPPWSPSLCKGMMKAFEFFHNNFKGHDSVCKAAVKAFSNIGGYLVDYVNEELLNRAGHNVKEAPLDNASYAHVLRDPEIQKLLSPRKYFERNGIQGRPVRLYER